MKFEKPKTQRTYVRLTDPDKKLSIRSFTVYGATPEDVRTVIEKAIKSPVQKLAKASR